MPSLRLRLFWKAPSAVRTVLASWNARRLDRHRHGPAYTEALRDIATRIDWSAEQFADHQRQQLVAVIRHAAAHVPYYRRTWRRMGIDPESIRGLQELARLPILEKDIVREAPTSLVDETLDRRNLIMQYTSGTTGSPLELYRNVRLHSTLWAYVTARYHSQAGVERRRDRSVSMGGQLVADPHRTRPPFWVYNRRWRQLYMSSFHLAPRYLDAYVAELRRFRPVYIEGYPASLYAVARHIDVNKLDPLPLKACFAASEPLFEHQRQAITRAFGCRTYEQYGCGELPVFATECQAGSMHLYPEFGIVEVVDEHDQPLPPGHSGQLVCTGLLNRVQFFIRYRIGDVGALSPEPCSCGCGRPVLQKIEGRIGNALVTPDGGRVSEAAISLLFYGITRVGETQIVQDDYDRFRVRLVPGKDYRDADGQQVVANLAKRLGPVSVSLEVVEQIDRTAAGKFRPIVSNLPAEHR